MASLLECKISKLLLEKHHCRVDAQPKVLYRFPSKQMLDQWLLSNCKEMHGNYEEDFKGNDVRFLSWVLKQATKIAKYFLKDVSIQDFANTKAGDAIIKNIVVPAIQEFIDNLMIDKDLSEEFSLKIGAKVSLMPSSVDDSTFMRGESFLMMKSQNLRGVLWNLQIGSEKFLGGIEIPLKKLAIKVPIVNHHCVRIPIEIKVGGHFDGKDGTILVSALAKGGKLFTLSGTCGLRIISKYNDATHSNLTSGVIVGASGVVHKGRLDASLVMKQSSLALDGVWRFNPQHALTMKLKQSKSYPNSTFQLGYTKMGPSFKSGIAASTRGTVQAYGETWFGILKVKYDLMQEKFGLEWKFGK